MQSLPQQEILALDVQQPLNCNETTESGFEVNAKGKPNTFTTCPSKEQRIRSWERYLNMNSYKSKFNRKSHLTHLNIEKAVCNALMVIILRFHSLSIIAAITYSKY
jgi:hypothetical protein